MNLKRIWSVLRKDLKLGPRNAFFLFAVIMPVVLTLIFQAAFGSLFEPKPRLGIVDDGGSGITSSIQQMRGIELTLLDDAGELKRQVKDNNLDAGLVLPAGFDEAVRRGRRPKLEFYIGGESLASNRIIISVTAIDLLRGIEGGTAPVEVKTVQLGEAGLPIAIRLVPLLVYYALVMAGIWVPAASLVGEKEKGTLTALLVTPTRVNEVLAAKWILGFLFSVFMAAMTLLLNRVFGPRPLDILAVITVAGVLNCMIGLLVGVISETSTMLFSLVKGTGIFLFAPVVFYIFPDWPQWIAKIFPLYWIIEPIWQVSVMGEPLSKVWLELTIALAISLALVPVIAALSRRIKSS
jgi:ABC-2 type transport system permease protein